MSLLFEMFFSLILNINLAMTVNIERIVTICYSRQEIINYTKSGLDLVSWVQLVRGTEVFVREQRRTGRLKIRKTENCKQ